MMAVRMIVIGAGVIGCSVALRLAEAGVEVLILDGARVGSGTSGRSFAWPNSQDKEPIAYHELNVAGMRAHAELVREFPNGQWWHSGGNIEWRAPEHEAGLVQKIERLHAWNYPGEWISAAQLHALSPEVDLACVGDAKIAHFPDEGWIDPVPFCYAMLSAARHHGAKLIREHVRELQIVSGHVTGVIAANGDVHGADMVINCAGRWADTVGVPALPLAPTFGLIAFTPPVPSGVRSIVHAPFCALRPDGSGRLMVRWGDLDHTVDATTQPSPDMWQARDLMQRLVKLLPCLAGIEAEAVRIGIRPIPKDSYPAIGPMPRVSGYYVAVTHSGVTMAPMIGAAVADELAHGRERAQLEPFRPSRFFN
jgi:glycine/D-amino acid oxidase-like deaminating enzyme